MRSYLSLIPITAKVRKRQNRMTLLCIVIAVFLVTTVFSMVQTLADMETESLIRSHGHWHISLSDISEDVLGIKIPKIVVPVSSGRSMSVIIEAAVMNMRLRDVGIDSSKEFVERILKNIDHNKQEQ